MNVLEGKVAVVAGASGGIGRAIANALGQHGAQLILCGRDLKALEETARSAALDDGQVHPHAGDFTQTEAVTAFVDAVKQAWGKVDILVHGIGYFSLGTVAQADVAELDRHYQINLRAPYLLTRKLLPLMEPANNGFSQIVFINATAAFGARADLGQYSAMKSALRTMSDCLRLEVNPVRIRVTTIFPSRTATAMQQRVRELEGEAYNGDEYIQPDDVAAATLSALLLPSSVQVREIVLLPFLGKERMP